HVEVQNVDIYERLERVARAGDIENLYELIADDANILRHFDEFHFCDTPLHIATENGRTHLAMERRIYLPGRMKMATQSTILLHQLIRLRIVNIKAKNLDGKTAMDILQTYKSPLFPKISRLLKPKKPSFIEKQNTLLGLLSNLSKIRHTSLNTSDNRSVIIVVAILIVTATYQAGFSPPGGFWQEDSKPGDFNPHFAG
ncbi:hypothetical protein CARUB_v10006499mg, partial [Capsella rubella]